MEITEKVAYLKGLAEGMELDTEKKEGKLLADIRDVSVNKDLPREERIAEFVRQIRDPYHFKCGRFVVRASFSQEGATLEECLRGILR